MITAKQARELMPTTVRDKVDAICEKIKEFAKAGKNRLRCGYDYDADKDLWIKGGYSNTAEWLEAVELLRSVGFEVDFFYEERQFVDMYTLIQW